MGSGPSAEPDQDSPSHPGEKVILSSPLEECTVPRLMEGCQIFLRTFINPMYAGILKSNEVVDISENVFTVKHILDGVKLDAAGYGSGDGKDKVVQWQRVEFKPDQAIIYAQNFLPIGGAWVGEASDEKVFSEIFTRFNVDPVQVEYWWVMEGERNTGPELAKMLSNILPHIVAVSKERLVPVQLGNSIIEPGQQSVISDPYEEHITWDKMWEMFTNLKDGYSILLGGATPEVNEIGENEFSITLEGGVEPQIGAFTVKIDEAAGKIVRTRKKEGKSQETVHQVLHREPQVIEMWLIDPEGQRKVDKFMAGMLAENIEKSIEKANSWFG